jgi:NAD(P)-dependent dehydrogenase (short-subunit alcohol dehydrogenase family)
MLEGKNVIVTGAGGGLGRAYALEAARQGAVVVVNDVDEQAAAAVAREIQDAGGASLAHAGSVADWDAAGRLVDTAVAELGAIHGLVNNAGVTVVKDAWDFTEADIRKVVDVNLVGTMFCGTHALRAMVNQGGGVIVNVVSGALVGILEHSLYGATKGGVMSLTYGWAMDTANRGVRVVGLSPLARTSMSLAWANRDEDHMDEPPPETVAPLVAFLLSDHEEAKALSGQIVRLDAGGLSLMASPRFPQARDAGDRSAEAIGAAFAEAGGVRDDRQRIGLTNMDLR